MILLQAPPPPPAGPPGGFPGGPFAGGPCGDAPCIPIDQGAVLLIVVGLIIGIYFLIKENKQWNKTKNTGNR